MNTEYSLEYDLDDVENEEDLSVGRSDSGEVDLGQGVDFDDLTRVIKASKMSI